jgi:hypothetical protein
MLQASTYSISFRDENYDSSLETKVKTKLVENEHGLFGCGSYLIDSLLVVWSGGMYLLTSD